MDYTDLSRFPTPEAFALAEDRQAILDQLVPGQEDHFAFTGAHLAGIGDTDGLAALLAAHKDDFGSRESYRMLDARCKLQAFDKGGDVDAFVLFLRSLYSVVFQGAITEPTVPLAQQTASDGAANAAAQAAPDAPSVLDSALLNDPEALYQAVFDDSGVGGFRDTSYPWLVQHFVSHPANTRDGYRALKSFLDRVHNPTLPGLVPLLAHHLASHEYGTSFSGYGLASRLTLAQLEELRGVRPQIIDDSTYVAQVLARMHPGPEVDLEHDLEARRAYAQACLAFATTLSPVFNGTRYALRFALLEADLREGVYDIDAFMDLVMMPSAFGFVDDDWVHDVRRAGTEAGYVSSATTISGLPSASSGAVDALVRAFLAHFLRDADTIAPFDKYIRSGLLHQIHAEARLTHPDGCDAVARYTETYSGSVQTLRDRVDLAFAPTNSAVHAAGAPVVLDVWVKNVPKLIVKVFEVNTESVYRETLCEVSEHISLDGLVPNNETVLEHDAPPMARVLRQIPILGGAPVARGVYVVELVGNGASLRAVVRVGRLHFVEYVSAAGHVLRVLNERNELCDAAQVYLQGHTYKADDNGEIVIPFTHAPTSTTLVLSDGDFSSLAYFSHRGETYRFDAAFYVDRECLLSKQTATAIVRAQLTRNGVALDLGALKQVALHVTTTDIDGVSSSQTVTDFELFTDRESVYAFQVPDKTVSVALSVNAKVRNQTQSSDESVSASKTFQLNLIDNTKAMDDIFLRRTADGYALRVLGKSGSPRPGKQLTVTLSFDHVSAPGHRASFNLATDDEGRITLGPLPHVSSVNVDGRQWTLAADGGSCPTVVHAGAGDAIALPFHGDAAAIAPYTFALLSCAPSGAYVEDLTSALVLQDGCVRVPQGLAPGDYHLWVTQSASGQTCVPIRVSAGATTSFADADATHWRYAISPQRLLSQTHTATPLAVARVATDAAAGTLTVHLAHATPSTRAHVVFSHFVPAYDAAGILAGAFFHDMPPLLETREPRLSAYHTQQALSSEYQYILDRKYAEKHPGNMLKRPSLLLALNDNPGNVDNVRRFTQSAGALRNDCAPMASFACCEDEDDDFCDYGEKECRRACRRKKKSGRSRDCACCEATSLARDELSADETRRVLQHPFRANLEFLPEQSVCLYNLEADAEGVVTVDLAAAAGGRTNVVIVVVDGDATASRHLALEDSAVAYNDMRLLSPLDATLHFAESKAIDVLGEGSAFAVDDKRTTETMLYDTIGRVYNLYHTLLGGSTKFEAFRFVTEWPSLSEEDKRTKYSEYASHELNLFVHAKDPAFFESVVAPFLANKKHKTFVDAYLLGDQDLLAFHAEPRAFGRLNIVEKVLLARAINDADKAAAIYQHVADQADLLPPNREAFNALHKIALKAKLEGGVPSMGASSGAIGGGGGRGGGGGGGNYSGVSTRGYFAPLPGTKEYGESNYYKTKIEDMDERLVRISQFWGEWAAHCASGSTDPFLSSHFAQAHRNVTEALLALAILDLPFAAGDHIEATEGASSWRLSVGSPAIMVHKQVTPTEAATSPLLVCQNFFDPDDRYREVNNERVEKFVTEEFRTFKVYGCQVAVTNVSTARQKVDILEQIPFGAVPLCGGFFTRSHYIELSSYATVTDAFYFYFPRPGACPQFPCHVSRDGVCLASAEPVTLNVVDTLTVHDTTSWSFVAEHGTIEDIVAFLDTGNPMRHDLGLIENRLGNRGSYDAIVALLRAHGIYHHRVWQYALLHGDREGLREWLQHADTLIDLLRATSDSEILGLDVEGQMRYQHLEYEPVVNARAHPVHGASRSIEPACVAGQYQSLLNVLALKPRGAWDVSEQLALVYYLLLQDRVEEAWAFFGGIDAASASQMQLQYDYFVCYFDIFFGESEGYAQARTLARQYVAHPVKRWRLMFRAVLQQLAEVDDPTAADTAEVDADDREAQLARLAATEPSFEFAVEGAQGVVSYQNLTDVQVNYYRMDIELLFSVNPFVTAGSRNVVKPNISEVHTTDEPRNGVLRFDVPEALCHDNVLIEVVARGITHSASYFACDFVAQMVQNYGLVRVCDKQGTPIKNAYVKVYAECHGSVRFWKDGYTDFRGKFDYATISGDALRGVSRFGVLVITDNKGCVVKEVGPPKM